jgi:hypothetical protein
MNHEPAATAADVHSCSLYCDRPACIKAQRDQLRDAAGFCGTLPAEETDEEFVRQVQAMDADDAPLEWSGAVPFLTMVQNTAGIEDKPRGDEFLAWYRPDEWFGEHRACAAFLGVKLMAVQSKP